MKINVKCMTEEAYKTLQKNCNDVYQMIIDHPSDCSWLKEYLGFEPFETKKYVIEDFELNNDDNYQNVAFGRSSRLNHSARRENNEKRAESCLQLQA